MSEPTEVSGKLSFDVKRVYDATVETVWNAWTDPERVKEWWGPEGFTSPMCRMDFREGGKTLVSMSAPGFGELFNTWTYTRIDPLRQIEFVMRFSDSEGNDVDPAELGMPPGVPAEVPHVVVFEDVGDGRTALTVTERGYGSPEAMQLSKAGQEQVLDKLGASLMRANTGAGGR